MGRRAIADAGSLVVEDYGGGVLGVDYFGYVIDSRCKLERGGVRGDNEVSALNAGNVLTGKAHSVLSCFAG